ncbi:MAG: ribokinase [Phycisphaeraceae bacterium]|nr:ribokinase [Phycisphaeraceae bacterium]
MANILVIGSANMDVVAPLRRLPSPGETILIEDVQLVHGGKGANAAVAAARLGGEVRFIGCVGPDAFGNSIRKALTAEGIDCDHLRTGSRGTGTAVILLEKQSAQNAIMVGPGANHQITLPASDELFQWADVMMLQLDTPVEVNTEAARRARLAGVRVILDPAPAADNLPDELLLNCDIVSPNETELATLSGKPVNNLDEAIAAAAALLERGLHELVVKMGDKGALWMTRQGRQFVPSVKVEPVDTTAAGDAFTGALAVALGDGRDMIDAIRWARLAGALACTKMGAQPSLPSQAEVEAFAASVTDGQ